MASHTPNLDLLKKDPITDGSQTFNIETMLNENWDKIDSAVGQVREELADIDIPLSDATNGNRSDVAASERAVGEVMSAAQAAQTTANAANMAAAAAQTRADSAFQLGNERKAEVVAALVAKGVSASTSESWNSLIAKMAGIIKATGNATAVQLLQGYTASNASGPITGSMPHLKGARAPLGVAKWPNGDLAVYNSLGYQDGGAGNGELRVTAALMQTVEPLFNGQNIAKDATIFGIQGLLERMTTSEKQDIVNAITAKGIPASINDSNTVLAQKIGQIEKRQYYKQTYPTFESGSAGTIDVTVPFTPKIISVYAQSTITGRSNHYSLMAASVSIVNNPDIKTVISSLTFDLSGIPTGSSDPIYLRDSSNKVITGLMPLSNEFRVTQHSGRVFYNLVIEAWG